MSKIRDLLGKLNEREVEVSQVYRGTDGTRFSLMFKEGGKYEIIRTTATGKKTFIRYLHP